MKETITIQIIQDDVYEEVAKATDYTGAKLIDSDADARDRILAADDDLAELSRFWEESTLAVNEHFKEMLISGKSGQIKTTETHGDSRLPPFGYEAVIEVSKSFDKALATSVQSTLRSFFIASIIGQWFKFANKGEAKEYFTQAAEMMETAERLLYSRRKPARPID
jgi:hypothetical protein